MRGGPLEYGEVVVLPSGRRAQVKRRGPDGVIDAWYINGGRPDSDDQVEIHESKVRRFERGMAAPLRLAGATG